MSKIQATLAILKPDIMLHPIRVEKIHQLILDNGFKIFAQKTVSLNRELAQKFYNEHRGKFFYDRLVNLIVSGPLTSIVIVRENAIGHWRNLIGPSRCFRARDSHPNTIRAIYGLTDTRNAVHGSDSEETAALEIQFFFPGFSYNDCIQSFSTSK